MDREFPFEVELTVRYRDLDTLEHVNNAVYGTYLEQARIRYFDEVLDVPFEDREMVLASVDVDFLRPITLDEEVVRVACGVVGMGESSFDMEYRVYGGSSVEPAALAETVQVVWDGAGSRPIPEGWREQFREYESGL